MVAESYPQGTHGPEAVSLYQTGSCPFSVGVLRAGDEGGVQVRDVEKPESI